MNKTLDSVSVLPGLSELSPGELQEIRGGGGGKDVLWHIVKRAVDCIIDDWDKLTECFKEGMEEAKG